MGQADAVAAGDRINYTPGSALAIGEVVPTGDRCFVADRAIAANAAGSLAATGLFNVAKNTGAGITVGTKLYWDNTNKYVSTSSSGNKALGFAAATTVSADTKQLVLLAGF